jgi:tRNA dimethylallyltransferase
MTAAAPPRVLALVGPTASGKTALSLALARELGAEIINCDSRQVVRGMDIGTGKPGAEERTRVPHHLFDVVDPGEPFSAAEFARRARGLVGEIRSRGRLPILVGGTGLYLRAYARGLFEGPPRSVEIHGRLERIAERGGLPRLHRWLARRDPAWAARVGPNDRQRILRGLDVWLQSGRSVSEHIAVQPPEPEDGALLRIALEVPRGELLGRISARVRAMLEAGWLDEVRALLGRPGFAASNAATALGYRSLMEHLAGKRDLASAVEEIEIETRRLAKRQMTWFRHEPGVHWLPATDPRAVFEAALDVIRPCLLGLRLTTQS